jgi:hypothetical protein
VTGNNTVTTIPFYATQKTEKHLEGHQVSSTGESGVRALAVCTGFVLSKKPVSVITHTYSELSAQCCSELSSREESPVTALPFCFSVLIFSCFFFPSFPVRKDSLGKERLPEREIS